MRTCPLCRVPVRAFVHDVLSKVVDELQAAPGQMQPLTEYLHQSQSEASSLRSFASSLQALVKDSTVASAAYCAAAGAYTILSSETDLRSSALVKGEHSGFLNAWIGLQGLHRALLMTDSLLTGDHQAAAGGECVQSRCPCSS